MSFCLNLRVDASQALAEAEADEEAAEARRRIRAGRRRAE